MAPMTNSLKVHRIYAGHGIARRIEIQVPNKPGYHYKFEFVGSLWSMKTWITAGEQLSRGDAVILIGRTLWRLKDKVAIPLTIQSHEYFRPWNWNYGAAFVYGVKL